MRINRPIVRLIFTLALIFISAGHFRINAVTAKEMEQARATTALWYLRYANNGSDYLEKLSPASLADLENSLKSKEKENIKAFKAVKTPSDYASWDKEKLVEYWSVTFFKSPGLDEKGVIARNRVKSKLQTMSVAAPAPDEPKEVSSQKGEETSTPAESLDQPVKSQAEVPSGNQIVDSAEAMLDSAMASTPQLSAAESQNKESSSSTWIYIVALILLVGVVVWLVIFASKTMQGDRAASEERNPEPVKSSKDEDVKVLQREIKDLREECLRLGEENGRLTADLSQAKREVEALRGRLRAASAVAASASRRRENGEDRGSGSTRDYENNDRSSSRVNSTSRSGAQEEEKEIYLGRVNAKGLFVRADRRPVEGKSIYVLTTRDGYTGSFRILQKEYAIDLGLENPEYYLSGGCLAPDILDTENAEIIRTVASGTAIFEDGCWRVLRKAKISYE